MTRTCEACGKVISKASKWRWDYYATRRFCDKACEHAHRPQIASSYVVDNNGCWVWQGRVDANGYGRAYDPSEPRGRRNTWAHRVSYRIHRGPIPAGHELDHLCENRRCINPNHLDPVRRAEHVARTNQRARKATA